MPQVLRGIDPSHDLTPVAVMVNPSNMLVVHSSLLVKSVRELIAFAKAHPGELSDSSGGQRRRSESHCTPHLFDPRVVAIKSRIMA